MEFAFRRINSTMISYFMKKMNQAIYLDLYELRKEEIKVNDRTFVDPVEVNFQKKMKNLNKSVTGYITNLSEIKEAAVRKNCFYFQFDLTYKGNILKAICFEQELYDTAKSCNHSSFRVELYPVEKSFQVFNDIVITTETSFQKLHIPLEYTKDHDIKNSSIKRKEINTIIGYVSDISENFQDLHYSDHPMFKFCFQVGENTVIEAICSNIDVKNDLRNGAENNDGIQIMNFVMTENGLLSVTKDSIIYPLPTPLNLKFKKIRFLSAVPKQCNEVLYFRSWMNVSEQQITAIDENGFVWEMNRM